MFYAVEWLHLVIYDWSMYLLQNMKTQLTEWKNEKMKNFRYGNILCSFFFETVPSISPRVFMAPHTLWEPCLLWWSNLIQCLGGGRLLNAHDDAFFDWWECHIISIDNYPYEEIHFSCDRDMLVPPGVVLGVIIKKNFKLFNFFES